VNRRDVQIFIILIFTTVLLLVLMPFVGQTRISFVALLDDQSFVSEHLIFWQHRVPRVLLAFLVGVSLSVGGVCFQAVFKNSLATPFTLGVSSGASLGVAVYVHLGLGFAILGISGIGLFAFFGGSVSVLLVYTVAKLRSNLGGSALLLAGVAINFFFSGLILFLQYISPMHDSNTMMRWMMGSVSVIGYSTILQLLPFLILGLLILYFLREELNLLSVGNEFAISRGININLVRNIIFFLVSLLTGVVVAICGPIGFVGMICPHICRLMVGNNHRYLLPASMLFGGSFLLFCDTLSRIIIAYSEIPVGVITALLGGPFFLGLLIYGKRIH